VRFFLRIALGLILAVFCLLGSGCTPQRNPTMKNDIPPIDRSIGADSGSRLQNAMERPNESNESGQIAQVAASRDAESNVPRTGGEAPGSPAVKATVEEPPEKSRENLPAKSLDEFCSAVATQETAAASPLPSAVKKLYAVQIMAFRDIAKAKRFTEKTKRKFPDIRWVRANIKGKGVWYRILVGPFCTKSDTTRYREGKGINDLYSDSFIREIALPLQGKPQIKPQGKPRRFLGP
jgi:septal ring-binding cell division protein DamX